MFDERALDLEGSDPVARRGDDVVGAPHEGDAAVGVGLDGVAAQVVVADEGRGRTLPVAGEPHQGRALPVEGEDARLPGSEFRAVGVEHDDPVARDGEAGGAEPDRVREGVVVADDHSELRLPVMIVNGGSEMIREPADDLGIERLARAADDPQLPLDRRRGRRPGGDEEAKGGRGAREVRDAEPLDGPVGLLDGEGAVVERRRAPHRERAGDGVVEAVGPARIGDVPEAVVLPQIHGIPHVADEGHDRLERDEQRLGRTGRAGGEHDQERVVRVAGHRRAVTGLGLELGPEIGIGPCAPCADGDDRAEGLDAGDLRAVGGIRHDDPRSRVLDALLDGLRTEGGEQRLVDGTETPRRQDRDQQFRRARDEAGHAIPLPHAALGQNVGEPGRLVGEGGEGDLPERLARPAVPERDALGIRRMAVAAGVAGVDPLGSLRKDRREGGGVIEVGHGTEIVGRRLDARPDLVRRKVAAEPNIAHPGSSHPIRPRPFGLHAPILGRAGGAFNDGNRHRP